MERGNRWALILFVIVLVLIVYFFFNPFTFVDKKKIPSKFSLSDKAGIDLTPDRLNFGALMPNQTKVRHFDIKNEYKKRILVTVEAEGDIAGQIIVDENNFFLQPGENKELTFTAYSAGLTEFREYSGYIVVISRKA